MSESVDRDKSVDMDPYTEGQEDAATHEAGHAIMRWLRGLPPTALWVDRTGIGQSEGTGRLMPAEDLLLVALAGMATLALCSGPLPNLRTSTATDVLVARHLLSRFPRLRTTVIDDEPVVESIDAALERWFLRAMDEIDPHPDALSAVTCALLERGRLGERRVRAILWEYEKSVRPGSRALRRRLAYHAGALVSDLKAALAALRRQGRAWAARARLAPRIGGAGPLIAEAIVEDAEQSRLRRLWDINERELRRLQELPAGDADPAERERQIAGEQQRIRSRLREL